MDPHDRIDEHFRLTAVQKSALKRLGLETIRDLLWHFPSRYEHLGESTSVSGLQHGAKVTLYGTLSKVEAKKLWKSRRPAAEGWFEDGTGRVKVMWFNQPYMANMVPQNTPVKITGTVSGKDKPYITNPEVEKVPPGSLTPPSGSLDEIAADARRGESDDRDVEITTAEESPGPRNKADIVSSSELFPVYPESRGVTSRWFYHTVQKVLESGVLKSLADPLPADIVERYHLPALADALVYLHTPQQMRDAEAARKRFAFEEIFIIQVSKQLERAQNNELEAPVIDADQTRVQTFIDTLPYALTGAQKRAIDEILADFANPAPMARLLEGDVGSGKTAVATATAYAAVTSRPPGRNSGTLQVAYMAPTEILATQHFHSFIEYFKELPINIALITGSGCYKFPSKVKRGEPTSISRTQLLKWVANGEVAMVVGTHALIQKAVQFQHLAYAIVDEQHRFGTNQRKALAQKNRKSVGLDAIRGAGKASSETYGMDTATSEQGARNNEVRQPHGFAPHFLSMTATPIPRTLALTIYGDLDISVLDELPPDRAGIETKLVKPDERAAAYETVRTELAAGRQAYVICPRIDEPDPEKAMALRVKSAKAEAIRLQKDVFPEYNIGLMHGKLKPADKDAVMEQFARGDYDILVSTSVIEVGVNVPNATCILIEGAERFGLAQLHQLRGRVLRSNHQAYCFLLPDTKAAASLSRLRAIAKTRNGFELAEEDLKSRGSGDLYGRAQWGVSDIGMEALKNPRLIEAARTEARTLVEADPKLSGYPELQSRTATVGEKLHVE